MKRKIILSLLFVSLWFNILGGIYLLIEKEEVVDYNKIYMHPIIDDPYTAEMVAEIYFEDFLKSRNILEYKEEFHTTVMFDKDTYEWVVVYLPVYEPPGTLFGSNEPQNYSYEFRLRMDRGMLRMDSYDFLKNWY